MPGSLQLESLPFSDKPRGLTWAKSFPSVVGMVQDAQLVLGEVLPQAFQPAKGQSSAFPPYKNPPCVQQPPDKLDQLEPSSIWKIYSLFCFSLFVLADWKIFWCSGWLSDDPAAKHGHVQAVSGGSPHCASCSLLLCGSEHVGPSEKHLSRENAHAGDAGDSLIQTQELL